MESGLLGEGGLCGKVQGDRAGWGRGRGAELYAGGFYHEVVVVLGVVR